ncbi:MAG: chromate efflux transporter [Thermoanaerobaculia bacterium]
MSPPDFRTAFRYWLRLGCINFGGPAGQIAIMHRDLVERRRWISEERFLHALNFCMLLPGPEAQQLATYLGWLLHGIRGGLVAGTFFVLPSVFVLLALSWVYAAHGANPVVSAVLAGLKPVVLAIVLDAAIRIGRRAVRHLALALIAAAAFIAIAFWNVPFPWIVVGAGLLGAAAGNLWPELTGAGAVSRPDAAGTDGTDAPAGRRTALRPMLPVLTIGLGLWLIPLLLVTLWRGAESVHAQIYSFFMRAALVTFGGAYAVLAYVTQAAAGRFGWITPLEAVDGLALAETTPGPLIMVLQFIGFMAGWHHPEGMSPAGSAVLAGLLTTWATFVPSFLFIFLGAPYIEKLRGSRKLAAALSGITAAVVGVILQLALVFGLAVLWRSGEQPPIDFFGAALMVAAFVALRRFRLDVLWVIAGGAVAGLLWSLLAR